MIQYGSSTAVTLPFNQGQETFCRRVVGAPGMTSATETYLARLVGDPLSLRIEGVSKTYYLDPVTPALPLEEITEVRSRDRILRFREPLLFRPDYDADDSIYSFEYDRLGIFVFTENLQDLRVELESQILFLWDVYACEVDGQLAPSARELKQRLLKAIEEIGSAEDEESG